LRPAIIDPGDPRVRQLTQIMSLTPSSSSHVVLARPLASEPKGEEEATPARIDNRAASLRNR
jgi:hypothetical protein